MQGIWLGEKPLLQHKEATGIWAFPLWWRRGELWGGGLLHLRRTPLHLFTAQPVPNLKSRFPYKPQFLFPILNAEQGLWIIGVSATRAQTRFPPKIPRLLAWIPAYSGTQWAALRRKIDNLHGRVIWMKLHLTACLQANKRREGALAKLWGLAQATAVGDSQGKKNHQFFQLLIELLINSVYQILLKKGSHGREYGRGTDTKRYCAKKGLFVAE